MGLGGDAEKPPRPHEERDGGRCPARAPGLAPKGGEDTQEGRRVAKVALGNVLGRPS